MKDIDKRQQRAAQVTLPIIALDGEGYTKRSGAHLYTYVAASTEKHLVSDFYNPRGIATSELFDWLLSLPRAHLLVGYSLGYDRCKWLEGLPDAMIHALHRPELRARPETAGAPPMPIRWKNRYNVNLLSTRLDVSRPGVKHSARTVWDVFKFFQCSFVKALRAWGIGTPAEVARIEAMKARRGNFTRIGPRERRYCQEECRLLAALVRELARVHESEGLELRTFYGPGSTASLVLGRCGAQEQTRAQKKAQDKKRGGGKALRFAIACSYFGGRFECSHVGPVPGPLYSYDIASAYPYALAQLPCLAHGRWKHVIDPVGIANALSAGVACISYRIDAVAGAPQAWGPLPHRMPQKVKTAEGKKLLKAIVFPVSSAGGWAWSVELRAACKLHPGIALLEAWVWQPTCKHAPPFREEIVRLFLRRLQVGKGTRGIVLKLALNSHVRQKRAERGRRRKVPVHGARRNRHCDDASHAARSRHAGQEQVEHLGACDRFGSQSRAARLAGTALARHGSRCAPRGQGCARRVGSQALEGRRHAAPAGAAFPAPQEREN